MRTDRRDKASSRFSQFGNAPKKVKIKSKFAPEQAVNAQKGSKGYSSTLSLTLLLDRVGRITPRSCRFTSGKESRYPLYRGAPT
jgi:hypothetical protein